MGCGKSSVGRRLSELLCCRFMDLDEVIESREGRTIPEIFAADGEAAFRRMEHEALKMVIDEYSSSTAGNLVLALGGGTVMTPECAATVHECTYCIYLRATVDTLVSRLAPESAGRPMLQSPASSQASASSQQPDTYALRGRITALMSVRSSVYESVAHQIIETDGKAIAEIASACIPVRK